MKIAPLTMHHAWWIPALCIYFIIYSWLSKMNNDTADITPWYTSKYLWLTFFFGALCPFWLIISRVSKNLLFDGMLYDNIAVMMYIATMIALRCGDKFDPHHWVGLGLVVIGSILMRVTL